MPVAGTSLSFRGCRPFKRTPGRLHALIRAGYVTVAVDERCGIRQDERMTSLTGLSAASCAFADLATRVDAHASVRNESWPTAGAMIDHLGNIQAWATDAVRVGTPADRSKYTRPAERERVEWFQETSAALVETLEKTDPARECWTLWGAEPVVSFRQRRMTNEAGKHLWDLRTAIDSEPPMPAEISLAERANIMDEFVDALVPAARTREIEPLPRHVLLVAQDLWTDMAAHIRSTPSKQDTPKGRLGRRWLPCRLADCDRPS